MIRTTLALTLIGLLSACGAAGLPTPPAAAPASGVTMGGTLSAGVAVNGTGS
jgi:hypothetical protein